MGEHGVRTGLPARAALTTTLALAVTACVLLSACSAPEDPIVASALAKPALVIESPLTVAPATYAWSREVPAAEGGGDISSVGKDFVVVMSHADAGRKLPTQTIWLHSGADGELLGTVDVSDTLTWPVTAPTGDGYVTVVTVDAPSGVGPMLVGIDMRTGAKRWERPSSLQAQSLDGVYFRPMPRLADLRTPGSDDSLVIGDVTGPQSMVDCTVAAIDASTGKNAWCAQGLGVATHIGRGDGLVAVASWDGVPAHDHAPEQVDWHTPTDFYLLNAATGAVVGHTSQATDNNPLDNPFLRVADDGVLLSQRHGETYTTAAYAVDGSPLWSTEPIASTFSYDQTLIAFPLTSAPIVVTSEPDRGYAGRDLQTGMVTWRIAGTDASAIGLTLHYPVGNYILGNAGSSQVLVDGRTGQIRYQGEMSALGFGRWNGTGYLDWLTSTTLGLTRTTGTPVAVDEDGDVLVAAR